MWLLAASLLVTLPDQASPQAATEDSVTRALPSCTLPLLSRNLLVEDLARVDEELGARREDLASWDKSFAADQAEYMERVLEAQRNTRMLESERESIERTGQKLRETHERIQAGRDELSRDIEERNRRAETIRQRGAVRAAESGRYVEEVRSQLGEILSVKGEIRVFRFASHDELVVVIAHELGHALGLGHTSAPGSIMGEVLPGTAPRTGAKLSRADVDLLTSQCPDL